LRVTSESASAVVAGMILWRLVKRLDSMISYFYKLSEFANRENGTNLIESYGSAAKSELLAQHELHSAFHLGNS